MNVTHCIILVKFDLFSVISWLYFKIFDKFKWYQVMNICWTFFAEGDNQGPRSWEGRVGICPPSFSEIRGKKSLKIAKFVQLVCTYCRCYQNLWSCPPSFYKIASPLLSIWYVKKRQLKLNQLCVWIWKGCHNFTYFANDAGKRCILFRYHSKITLIPYHKN